MPLRWSLWAPVLLATHTSAESPLAPTWKNLNLDSPGVFFGQVHVDQHAECNATEANFVFSAVRGFRALGSAGDGELCTPTCVISTMQYRPDVGPAEIELPRSNPDLPPRSFIPEVGRVAQVTWADCAGHHTMILFAPPGDAPAVPLRHTVLPGEGLAACCAEQTAAAVGADGESAFVIEGSAASVRHSNISGRLRVSSVNLWNINPGPGTFSDRRDRLRHYLLRMMHVGDVSGGVAAQGPSASGKHCGRLC